MQVQRSLIAEIEGAIASGSSEKRVDTLRRVTDLFLVSAESISDDQVGVFDDVITRLAERIETKARAELAGRLAPVKNAPIEVVRKLARDESFEVAGPVLTQSNRLTEQDLLACAESNSQERLLAISKRATISEAVSDALVTRGDKEVVRSVARNEGARFSETSFVKLVEKSEADDELAVSVGSRKDIPKQHFQALVAKASEAVFKKLSASNPAAAAEVKRVLQVVTGHSADAKIVRDYTQAKAAVEAMLRTGQQVDPAVHNFATGKKFEETVVALAALCRLPIDVVERALMDKGADHDLTLILSKAAGLTWPTAKLIMLLRAGEGGVSAHVMEEMHQDFQRLQPATAQRVVRFYQVRHSSGEKPH